MLGQGPGQGLGQGLGQGPGQGPGQGLGQGQGQGPGQGLGQGLGLLPSGAQVLPSGALHGAPSQHGAPSFSTLSATEELRLRGAAATPAPPKSRMPAAVRPILSA
jgi:hypothetical protein